MILVAGGTGHLGRRLVPLLVARGLAVRALTRHPDRAPALAGATLVGGDVRDPASLRAAVIGVDTIVSAITGFGPGGAGPLAIDAEGNRALIDAAEAAGVRRYVLLSMHGAAPDHPLELLRMKFRAEEHLRQSGLAWTIVRPTVFMELWLDIICAPLRTGRKATVFGRGSNPINFISVDDLAQFIELAIASPALVGSAVSVGGPEDVTLMEMVRRFSQLRGTAAGVRHVPLRAMRIAELLLRPVRPDLAGLVQAGRRMDSADMRFDGSALRRSYPEIGRIGLAEAIGRDRPAA